jgi:prepilin-type processing-associated H-X9-DG protein
LEQNVEGGSPLGPDRQGLGWAFQILPFIEETAAYNLTRTQDLQEVVVTIYVCPSRRAPRTSWSPGYMTLYAFHDYAGAVPCTYTDPSRTTRYDPTTAVPLTRDSLKALARHFRGGALTFGGTTVPNNALYDGVIIRCPWDWQSTSGNKQIGVFHDKVPGLVRMGKVTDGTSKTLMISEKYVRSDNYEGSNEAVGHESDDRGWTDGWDGDIMRSTCYVPIQDSDGIGWSADLHNYFIDYHSAYPFVGTNNNVLHFGSPHAGGINAVFADGSVHYVSYDVDVLVFNGIGSRNGDESIELSALN